VQSSIALALKLFRRQPHAQGALDEELARGLIQTSSDALVVIDGDGRIDFINGSCEAVFGYRSSEIVGHEVELLVPERFREAHRRHVAAFIKDPKMRPMGTGLRLSGRKRDGTEFPVDIALSPVRTSRGSFVAAAIRDTSEREETRRVLREAEERFHLAFEEAPVGMALVEPDGRMFRVNRAYGSIVGYSPSELVGRTFQSITHPDDLDESVALAKRIFGGEVPSIHVAKRYIHKNGRVVDVMLHVAPLRDLSGKPLYTIAQAEDITAAKELEQLRAEWGWVVANDLLKPLSSIVLSAQSMLLKQMEEGQARRALERIKVSAGRLHRMVGDLMDLQRLDTRQLELSRRPVEVGALVRGAAERMEFERPGREIDVRITGHVTPIHADPDRIEQVVDILLGSIDRHSDPSEAILVDVRGDGDRVRIAVTSEGKGIPPEQVAHLFDRFQPRGGGKVGGFRDGFAMYFARELVEAHGGSIGARNLPHGKTQLELALPVR
jgi:PAS domain S-box-containing protein